MEVIISDTNIFIDLHSIGLLEAFCKLPCEVRTIDFIVAEITDPEQSQAISALAAGGKLVIESLDAEELTEIIAEHSSVPGNISIPDCSVCFYARKHSATLLTGDRQLRKYAEACNVTVRGILFIFDELIANKILTRSQAVEKLRKLVGINVRLPKTEIEKRINNWIRMAP